MCIIMYIYMEELLLMQAHDRKEIVLWRSLSQWDDMESLDGRPWKTREMIAI